MIWNLVAIILLGVFVVLVRLFLKNTKHLKAKYRDVKVSIFKEDSLVKKELLATNDNQLYRNNQLSKDYIDQYIISYEGNKPYLICNLANKLEEKAIIAVYCYNHKKELSTIIYIENIDNTKEIPPIALSTNVVYVNIHLESTRHIEDTQAYFKARSKAYLKFGLLSTLTLFFLMIPLSYSLLNILIFFYTESTILRFMTIQTILLGFILIIISCLFNFGLVALRSFMSFKVRGGLIE